MGSLAEILTRGGASALAPQWPAALPRPLGRIARRGDPPSRRDEGERSRAPLEHPFAYLSAQGLAPPGAWLAAQVRARALGVGVDDALIAAGALDEAALAQGFARRWRLAYLDAPALDPQNGPGVFAAGVARLDGAAPSVVVAPRGVSGQALANALRRAPASQTGHVAVTPAPALRAAAYGALGPRLAREAAASLPEALSARRLAGTPAQAAALAVVAATAAMALAPQGLAGALATLLLGLVFLMAVVARLATTLAATEEPGDAPPLAERDLPRYAVVVALHREENVVADLVAALDRLDYPREKLRVTLAVEQDDAATRAALAGLVLPPHFEVAVVAPGAPRTKPRALNVALAAADAELLVVYDAEDRPQPDQLRKAAARFAVAPREVVCLQARLAIDNAQDNVLTRLFALDYAGLFEIANPGLAALDWPMLLGGTSNHFRVADLRAIGGWDAWNVTEDADLGLRLARSRLRVETLRSTTWEEAPVDLAAWEAQRRRWLKGWMQTAFVHSRAPRALLREIGLDRALALVATLGGGQLSALLSPLFALRVGLDMARGDFLRVETNLDVMVATVTLTLLALGPVCAILPPLLATRRAGLSGLARFAALLPLYHLMLSWSAWRAAVELARKPHRWTKTRHGVSAGRRTFA